MLTLKERKTKCVILRRMAKKEMFHLFMVLKVTLQAKRQDVRGMAVLSTSIRLRGGSSGQPA